MPPSGTKDARLFLASAGTSGSRDDERGFNLRSNAAAVFRCAILLVAVQLLSHSVTVAAQADYGVVGEPSIWHEATSLKTRVVESNGRPSAETVLRLAELEFALGYTDRTDSLLRDSVLVGLLPPAQVLLLRGRREYEAMRFAEAAEAFARAAALSAGTEAGVLAARAGDAYERSGNRVRAAEYYRVAAIPLPQIAGWLAVREARTIQDVPRALQLLALAPPAARKASLRIRAELLLAAPDTFGAVAAFAAGGYPAEAAQLAILARDSVTARSLAYRAATASDTSQLHPGTRLVLESFPPASGEDHLIVARATNKMTSARAAVRYAEEAAEMDATSAEAWLLLGDLLVATGARTRALDAYLRAAVLDGEAAGLAAYKRGSLLLRVGRYASGMEELLTFVGRYPDDYRAPIALYAVADRLGRSGGLGPSDSVFGEVSRRWPTHAYATRARSRLIARSINRGDSATAAAWLKAEVDLGGSDRNSAHFRLAAMTADRQEAKKLYAELARRDSVGYYGTIARELAGLPPIQVDPVIPTPVTDVPHQMFAALDLLRESHFVDESTSLVTYLSARDTWSPAELLDVAEGLVERGYTAEGIRLGWRATASFTLNHPRVLRVIFPWPHREMIEAEAEAQGLDPYLLVALIRQESAFRSSVVSRAGAYGLTQLMPATAREVARKLRVEWNERLLVVADANLHIGATHLASLLGRYDGDVVPALAAYNAGATPVRRWLRYPEAKDPVSFVERIPYSETRGYLRTVLRNRSLYRALYPPAVSIATDAP